MINKLLITFLMITSFVSAKEVSAFGAGDISSPNPYGLTSTEKHILHNKNKLDKFDTSVKTVRTTIESLSERIDGLESILEGDSKKLHDNVNNLNQVIQTTTLHSRQLEQSKTDTVQLRIDIDNIKLVIEKLLEDQQVIIQNEEGLKKDLSTLKKHQDSLTKLVNSINSVYVSQNELKSNMSQFVTKQQFDKLVSLIEKKKKKSSSKSKKQMMEEARSLFKKQHFTKAIPMYEELIQLNYKPAESNYTLGEMWYVRKKYKKAISYFKQSALLYDKGWWMPNLLFHSAISFEKINDLDNAATFYSTLIEIYPDSKQAKEAQKNISNQ